MEVTQLTEGPLRDRVRQLQGACQRGVWRWQRKGRGSGARCPSHSRTGLGAVLGALHLLVHLPLKAREVSALTIAILGRKLGGVVTCPGSQEVESLGVRPRHSGPTAVLPTALYGHRGP